MSHDKISAAARKRMAETGESYAAARRAVLNEHQAAGGQVPTSDTRWFALSFRNAGMDRITVWFDTLFGGGPGRAGAEVSPDEIRVRTGGFHLDIPRASVRSVQQSQFRTRGTTGVHHVQRSPIPARRTIGVHPRPDITSLPPPRSQWLVNGSADGLVEITIEPPSYVKPSRQGFPEFLTRRVTRRVDSLILSLADPDGFIAAVESDEPRGD